MIAPDAPAAQGGGSILLYSDPLGTDCFVDDNPAGTIFVYVFHTFHPGATGSQFRIQQNGTNWVFAADLPQSGTLVVGTAETGATYSYGACRTGHYNFLNLLYTATGSAEVCATLWAVADSTASGTIEATMCDSRIETALGWWPLTVNSDGSCPCGVEPAVESSSWGRIKALYGQERR